jgi:hypothetical protein
MSTITKTQVSYRFCGEGLLVLHKTVKKYVPDYILSPFKNPGNVRLYVHFDGEKFLSSECDPTIGFSLAKMITNLGGEVFIYLHETIAKYWYKRTNQVAQYNSKKDKMGMVLIQVDERGIMLPSSEAIFRMSLFADTWANIEETPISELRAKIQLRANICGESISVYPQKEKIVAMRKQTSPQVEKPVDSRTYDSYYSPENKNAHGCLNNNLTSKLAAGESIQFDNGVISIMIGYCSGREQFWTCELTNAFSNKSGEVTIKKNLEQGYKLVIWREQVEKKASAIVRSIGKMAI